MTWLFGSPLPKCPVLGRVHDYKDGNIKQPMHFYTYTCDFCGGEFTI